MNTRIGRGELDTYPIMSAPSDGSDNKIPSPEPTMSRDGKTVLMETSREFTQLERGASQSRPVKLDQDGL
jgi:hypothetical protein